MRAPAAGLDAAASPAMNLAPPPCCGIDFGTSNSAVALPRADGIPLVPLEDGQGTMPTAVFYLADGDPTAREPDRLYGRAAVAAYVDGLDGRLMRSMKSLLGSDLIGQVTDVGGGRALPYTAVIEGYLRHLKACADRAAGAPLTRAVLGRPVFFVDDDPVRDAQAERQLAAAARAVGLRELQMQFEPIAAALAYEDGLHEEQLVLVADIGGGTSDFSLVRVGPSRRGRLDRRDDILGNHGVHVAGTDFDRRVSLAALMPELGHGAPRAARPGEAPRQMPSGLYHDLATWHLINTVYAPARLAEWRAMRSWFAEPRQHGRLMRVLDGRLGHALAALAEQAKIDVAQQGQAAVALGEVEPGLAVGLDAARAAEALADDQQRIVDAARETLHQAGVAPSAVQALFCTGGSTGLGSLVTSLSAVLPAATVVRGDRFASVVRGLGVTARQVFSGDGGPAALA